jgi:hypothetical protein
MGQPEPVRLVDARPTGPAPVTIGAVLDRALETALTLLRADRGNIQIAVPSRFQPVQSTPLIDQTGRLVGMISTHYPRPYRPPDRDLWIIQQFGRLVGAAMTAGWDSPLPEVG